jgi:hypothetical protein
MSQYINMKEENKERKFHIDTSNRKQRDQNDIQQKAMASSNSDNLPTLSNSKPNITHTSNASSPSQLNSRPDTYYT